jgi:hypothetical protein
MAEAQPSPEREHRRAARTTRAGWRSGLFLFAYAIAFSFAYVTLTASTGALILFAAVQATIITGRDRGRMSACTQASGAGLEVAMGRLVYLTMPGLSAPPSGRMCADASARRGGGGLYTLRGDGSRRPSRHGAKLSLCPPGGRNRGCDRASAPACIPGGHCVRRLYPVHIASASATWAW